MWLGGDLTRCTVLRKKFTLCELSFLFLTKRLSFDGVVISLFRFFFVSSLQFFCFLSSIFFPFYRFGFFRFGLFVFSLWFLVFFSLRVFVLGFRFCDFRFVFVITSPPPSVWQHRSWINLPQSSQLNAINVYMVLSFIASIFRYFHITFVVFSVIF